MTLEGQAFFHFSFLVKKFVAFVLALLGFNFNCKSISPSMRALDSLHWCGTFFTTPVSVRIRQVNACFLGWEDTNYNAKYPTSFQSHKWPQTKMHKNSDSFLSTVFHAFSPGEIQVLALKTFKLEVSDWLLFEFQPMKKWFLDLTL